MPNPFNTVLGLIAERRRDRQPVTIKLPKRITDTGAPSPKAIAAREARMRASTTARETRDAKQQLRGDYQMPKLKR